MFIGNFQGTYERPSIVETLKTIRQKHDESLWDYVKYFCNARNDIPYIQDVEIINVFRDGVCDIKTVEEIAMKKAQNDDRSIRGRRRVHRGIRSLYPTSENPGQGDLKEEGRS
jgi:hypothetical protein